MKKLLLLLVFVFVFVFVLLCVSQTVFAGSNDVIRGEDMADKGTITEKFGISLMPHAEFELRGETIDVGPGSNTSNNALAFGLAIKRGRYVLDIYGKDFLDSSDDDSYSKTDTNTSYGVTLAKIGQHGMYYSFALESREIKFIEAVNVTDDTYSLEIRSFKPGVGFASVGRNYSNVIGGGFILFTGDVAVDYYDIYKGRRLTGGGSTYGLGLFVQNKFAYHLSNSVSIPVSIYWEGATSLSDPEIEPNNPDDTISSSYWNLGVRLGMQFVF